MADVGHAETDRQLNKLERRINAEYKQASEEVQGKLDDYLRRFQTKDEIKREKVQTGEITQDEYTKWRYGQVMIGKRWEEMRDTLAQDLTNTDKIAMSMVRGYMPEVYALNHNYGVYVTDLLTLGNDFSPTPKDTPGYGKSTPDGTMQTVRLYHGSFAKFDQFDFDAGKALKGGGSDMYGEGFYFTADKNQARMYGDNIYYVDVQYSTDFRTAKRSNGTREKDFSYNPETGYWVIPKEKADNIHIVGVEDVNTGEVEWKDPQRKASVGVSYTLYDRQTVENLIKKNPDLLPKPRVDVPKDLRWNKQHITSAITQGILQGEDIRKISKRLQGVTDMDRRAAIRNARTMTTSAENAGRSDSYVRAKEMGIPMEQVWLATLDERTRDSHRELDGEAIKVGDKWHHPKFSNGLRYPGDPDGPPAEVYNCRCTMVAVVDGVDPSIRPDAVSRNSKLGGMTYDEWKEEHQQRADARTARAQKSEQTADTIINGKDISATWKRRPNQFDFEIEDVINTQGFDGKPKVVSAEEFDRAVKESNFVAQRTYSAPDQETLNAYRDQLYNGKWYVDCSTGGAQYGQGMYCAADYTGTLTDGIKAEMEHYHNLGESRYGDAHHSYTETLTLDPSAKVITYRELMDIRTGNLSPDYRTDVINDLIKKSNYTDDEATFIRFNLNTGVTWNEVSAAAGRLTNERIQELSKEFPKIGEEAKKLYNEEHDRRIERSSMLQHKFSDPGSLAAALGYDAINAEGHGQSGSYTVILNRTKCIFKGE